MATTAIFAEILIIGLEVEAWLALGLLCASGSGWIDVGGLTDFASLLAVVVLAVAYVLGIAADRLADTLLDRFERTGGGERLKRRLSKNRNLGGAASVAVATMRMTVMHESDGMNRFLDAQRSRWQIARATVVNLALVGPLAALFLVVRTDESWAWAAAPLLGSLVLVPSTYFVGVRIQDAWIDGLRDAYAILRGAAPESRRGQVVAALCYRLGSDSIELLLVRTRGGRRWTFPKGHVEPGESPHAAAAREALEEAGVRGKVAATPLTSYRYPGAPDGAGPSLVSAFLLAVEEQGSPAPG